MLDTGADRGDSAPGTHQAERADGHHVGDGACGSAGPLGRLCPANLGASAAVCVSSVPRRHVQSGGMMARCKEEEMWVTSWKLGNDSVGKSEIQSSRANVHHRRES